MAFTGIMTTEAAIDQKSGAGVSVSFDAGMKTVSCSQGESFVNCICRTNYSSTFDSLNVGVKFILNDAVSSMVAIEAIKYDMSGYTSRTEAEDMINVLRDSYMRQLSLLKDKKVQEFMNNA